MYVFSYEAKNVAKVWKTKKKAFDEAKFSIIAFYVPVNDGYLFEDGLRSDTELMAYG